MKIKKYKLKKNLKIRKAIACIKSTFNNTIITIINKFGKVICWSSAGACGFKGAKKSTPFAAQIVGKKVGLKIKELGINLLYIIFSGQGKGNKSALQSIINLNLKIKKLIYKKKVPFNGCRSPKKRKL